MLTLSCLKLLVSYIVFLATNLQIFKHKNNNNLIIQFNIYKHLHLQLCFNDLEVQQFSYNCYKDIQHVFYILR